MRELLVLQLAGRGYSTPQIASLVETDERAVVRAGASAASALGTKSLDRAVAIARRLRLIL